ncbi:MAG: NAD(P)H-dependent glycerol-3-phosphate dehydrogenase [Clostridia bacterium]|nr:NAD(P)H-dependent glycerol-3-phosphate dehydrogenase [Clostridia bacterium]
MNITLLGCGRWGSFIAWYMDSVKHNNVMVWGRDNDPLLDNLIKTRKNDYVTFPDSIQLTHDLTKALNHSEVIIISISAQAVRSLMSNVTKIPNYKDKTFVLCMKGIEDTTGKRLSEVLIESGVSPDKIAVWVGPGHIQEFTRHVPNCMIIDSYNPNLTKYLVENFSSDLIRFYIGNDIIGSEIGAAAKNVMGIGAGMLDGLGYSVLKGALMARGAHEVARFIKAKGGNELSAYGLCHLGDYEATLFSPHSHNRKFGELFVKGEPFNKLAEGVATASAMLKIAKELNIDLPITQAIYNILNHKSTPEDILKSLFSRDCKKEFETI